MKIIALLPFKNEAWILPTYLSSITKIADEILALDDGSTDAGRTLLEDAGATVLERDFGKERVVHMSARRSYLLTEGRARGGTHFIWLDADETFSADFLSSARATIGSLAQGEKLAFRWVHLWKGSESYLSDPSSPFGYIWKDMVVCDDPSYMFEERFLSEGRTQGPHQKLARLPEKDGVVLHFQFVRWDALQMKQAWYRCSELIEGSRGPRRINQAYSITLESPLATRSTPPLWIDSLTMPTQLSSEKNWHEDEINAWFDRYGVTFFEPLQIWHVPSLRERFMRETGREPIPSTFPSLLIALNRIKNRILHG